MSNKELKLLQKGIFSRSMDEKWNIFILNGFLYLTRSWTNNCIYKASIEANKIEFLKVNRNVSHYKSTDLKTDSEIFKKTLQMYLNREDLFIDERTYLPMIKSTLEKYNKQENLRKSIGSQSIEINLKIYNSLKNNSEFLTIDGLDELIRNTKKYKL